MEFDSSTGSIGTRNATLDLNKSLVALSAILFNTTTGLENSKFISDEAYQYVMTINISIVCASVCLFGIVTNSINIVVFAKMKFKETINIAFLALAISDLGSLVSLLWTCICFNPLVMYSDIHIHTYELQLKTGTWTHYVFMRITTFITVYITLERCLCIVYPLKVKQILTPKRVVAIIVGISVLVIAGMGPNYATARLTWKYVPSRNRTMIGFVFTEHRLIIQTFTYYINVLFIIVSFTGVIACSSVLIWKLNQRGRWLSEASSGTQDNSSLSRDRQVVKMVVWVAIIFVISFIPTVVCFLLAAAIPEINLGKRYENLFFVNMAIFTTCDALNSSVNIVIYYKMSFKYSQIFLSLFIPNEEIRTRRNKP